MSEPIPEPFVKALGDLESWLERARIRGIIIGGVAASLLGRPRATRDIDVLALLAEDRLDDALAAAREVGIVARIEEPVAFARRTHVLLLRHAQSDVDLDVILGRLPFEEAAIARGREVNIAGVKVKLPQVEDLLFMKAVARRPHDLRDIEGLLDVHPAADVAQVSEWLRELADAAAMPELIEGFEKLLAQRARSR
jgi:predicted nucleotidyltransferase